MAEARARTRIMQQGSASSGATPLHSALHPRIRPAEEAPFRPGALAAALRQPHQNHYHYNFAPRPSATGPAYGSASADAVSAEWERQQQRRRLLDGGGDPNEDDVTAVVGNWAKAWAIARWVMLVLVIGLVIVGVTMLAQVFDRVGKVMEMMSSSDATSALQDALAHAHATTANIETASQNVAAITGTARASLEATAPVLLRAANETGDAVHALSSFSAHPSISIAAG